MDSSLKVGDLDSSIKILMDVIMEDTFGSAGQEKDADGYLNQRPKKLSTTRVLILLKLYPVILVLNTLVYY